MSIVNEGRHTGEHLLSEASGTRSREKVTVTQTGVALAAGTVLGKITASGKYVPYNETGTDDGHWVAAAVLYDNLPAYTGDVSAVVHVRDCELNAQCLTGLDANGKADLVTADVIVR